jgi:hypothetical protein
MKWPIITAEEYSEKYIINNNIFQLLSMLTIYTLSIIKLSKFRSNIFRLFQTFGFFGTKIFPPKATITNHVHFLVSLLYIIFSCLEK